MKICMRQRRRDLTAVSLPDWSSLMQYLMYTQVSSNLENVGEDVTIRVIACHENVEWPSDDSPESARSEYFDISTDQE